MSNKAKKAKYLEQKQEEEWRYTEEFLEFWLSKKENKNEQHQTTGD